jgi:hypothetical protein
MKLLLVGGNGHHAGRITAHLAKIHEDIGVGSTQPTKMSVLCNCRRTDLQ